MKIKDFLNETFAAPALSEKESNKLLRRLKQLRLLDKQEYLKKLADLNRVRRSEGIRELTDEDIKSYNGGSASVLGLMKKSGMSQKEEKEKLSKMGLPSALKYLEKNKETQKFKKGDEVIIEKGYHSGELAEVISFGYGKYTLRIKIGPDTGDTTFADEKDLVLKTNPKTKFKVGDKVSLKDLDSVIERITDNGEYVIKIPYKNKYEYTIVSEKELKRLENGTSSTGPR